MPLILSRGNFASISTPFRQPEGGEHLLFELQIVGKERDLPLCSLLANSSLISENVCMDLVDDSPWDTLPSLRSECSRAGRGGGGREEGVEAGIGM